jgi:integrase
MGMLYQRGKKGTWWIKFYRTGKPFYESSHSVKVGDAKRLLQKREGQIVEGKFTGVKADRVRFEDLSEGFLTDYRTNGKRSINAATRCVTHLKTCFAGLRAVAITTPTIKAYIAQRQAEGAANATINRELAAVKRMFTLALHDGVLYQRPYIPHLAENNVRTGFLGEIEYLSLREALPAPIDDLLTFMYVTGWRKSEASGLTWDRVDLAGGKVWLDPGTTKNREGRVFVLTEGLRSMLRTRWEMTRALVVQRTPNATPAAVVQAIPWVFHRDGAPVKDFRGAWKTACETAKLEGRIPHDLRRTAIRNMVRAGVSDLVAMRLSGHKTRSVFDRYNIVSGGDLEAAARLMDGAAPGAEIVTENVTVSTERGLIPANSSQDTRGMEIGVTPRNAAL